MARITINFDGLTQQATTLGALTQNYETLNARMKNMSDIISTSWKGEASTAYQTLMTKYYSQAVKLVEILNAFRGYATQATTDFESLDNSCATMIRNAF